MVALRERQYERIVDLAVTILRSHQTASPWPPVMDELAEALHCNAGIFADARHRSAGLRATVEAWTPAPLADLVRQGGQVSGVARTVNRSPGVSWSRPIRHHLSSAWTSTSSCP
jgi:hypothetical protein